MTIDIQSVLDCPMQENDSGADTIRGYLKALLLTLWYEGEGFSGKRPFGNSGWEYDLALALVKGGFVKGSIHSYSDSDEVYEDLDDYDSKQLSKVIIQAISSF